MQNTGAAPVPLSNNIFDKVEDFLKGDAGYEPYVFYWNEIPAEHLRAATDSLNSTYGICLSPEELWGLSILEACGIVQMHVMDRLDIRPGHREVLRVVADLIYETTDIDPATITMTQALKDDLDIDSMSVIQVMCDMEDKYGFKIPDAVSDDLKTVGDYVAWIANSTGATVQIATL